MKAIHLFDVAFRWTLSTLCLVLILTMTVAIGGQVVMRYVFSAPWVWSEELARYSMVWLVMLGAGLCSRLGQHIALTDFAPLPPRVLKVLSFAAGVVVLVMLSILIWYSWDLAERVARQTTPALRLPMSWVYAALPVGFTLMFVGTILNAVMLIAPGRDVPVERVETLPSAG